MQRSKYGRNRRSKRLMKNMMKGRMKGGMCPPCLMAGGVASGKLMLGAAAGITGISSVAALKSKKKNSFKRGGSKIKKRKIKKKKIKKRISRRNKTKRISKRTKRIRRTKIDSRIKRRKLDGGDPRPSEKSVAGIGDINEWMKSTTFEVVPPLPETPAMKTVRIEGLHEAAINAGMKRIDNSSEDEKLEKIKTWMDKTFDSKSPIYLKLSELLKPT